MRKPLTALTYRDEADKAYGLAGMVITAGALNAIDLLWQISLDSDGPMVQFTDEYYYIMSPLCSPVKVRKTLERNFYVTLSMIVGNLMGRTMVRDHSPRLSPSLLRMVRSEMEPDAIEYLGLEDDEMDNFLNHVHRNCHTLFSSSMTRYQLPEFAERLLELRTLSLREIINELNSI